MLGRGRHVKIAFSFTLHDTQLCALPAVKFIGKQVNSKCAIPFIAYGPDIETD
jgi:hypothetical protein